MLSKTIQNFLGKNKIKYEAMEHKTVYTALDKTATLRVKPMMVGKTVVLAFDAKEHALALIPANKNLDKKKLLKIINNSPNSPSYFKRGVGGVKDKRIRFSHADFAGEKWAKAHIKGVKIGTTPPFGPLYNLPLFLDNSLAKQPKIIVNGGDYTLSLKLSPTSLVKLENTIKGSFSQAKK